MSANTELRIKYHFETGEESKREVSVYCAYCGRKSIAFGGNQVTEDYIDWLESKVIELLAKVRELEGRVESIENEPFYDDGYVD